MRWNFRVKLSSHCIWSSNNFWWCERLITQRYAGLILGSHPANGRRRYKVTPSIVNRQCLHHGACWLTNNTVNRDLNVNNKTRWLGYLLLVQGLYYGGSATNDIEYPYSIFHRSQGYFLSVRCNWPRCVTVSYKDLTFVAILRHKIANWY